MFSRPGRQLGRAMTAGVGSLQLGAEDSASAANSNAATVRDDATTAHGQRMAAAANEAAELNEKVAMLQAALVAQEATFTEAVADMEQELQRTRRSSMTAVQRTSTRSRAFSEAGCTRADSAGASTDPDFETCAARRPRMSLPVSSTLNRHSYPRTLPLVLRYKAVTRIPSGTLLTPMTASATRLPCSAKLPRPSATDPSLFDRGPAPRDRSASLSSRRQHGVSGQQRVRSTVAEGLDATRSVVPARRGGLLTT